MVLGNVTPTAGGRVDCPVQDWTDLSTQAGTGGSGKPWPVSMGCDALVFSALIRDWTGSSQWSASS